MSFHYFANGKMKNIDNNKKKIPTQYRNIEKFSKINKEIESTNMIYNANGDVRTIENFSALGYLKSFVSGISDKDRWKNLTTPFGGGNILTELKTMSTDFPSRKLNPKTGTGLVNVISNICKDINNIEKIGFRLNYTNKNTSIKFIEPKYDDDDILVDNTKDFDYTPFLHDGNYEPLTQYKYENETDPQGILIFTGYFYQNNMYIGGLISEFNLIDLEVDDKNRSSLQKHNAFYLSKLDNNYEYKLFIFIDDTRYYIKKFDKIPTYFTKNNLTNEPNQAEIFTTSTNFDLPDAYLIELKKDTNYKLYIDKENKLIKLSNETDYTNYFCFVFNQSIFTRNINDEYSIERFSDEDKEIDPRKLINYKLDNLDAKDKKTFLEKMSRSLKFNLNKETINHFRNLCSELKDTSEINGSYKERKDGTVEFIPGILKDQTLEDGAISSSQKETSFFEKAISIDLIDMSKQCSMVCSNANEQYQKKFSEGNFLKPYAHPIARLNHIHETADKKPQLKQKLVVENCWAAPDYIALEQQANHVLEKIKEKNFIIPKEIKFNDIDDENENMIDKLNSKLNILNFDHNISGINKDSGIEKIFNDSPIATTTEVNFKTPGITGDYSNENGFDKNYNQAINICWVNDTDTLQYAPGFYSTYLSFINPKKCILKVIYGSANGQEVGIYKNNKLIDKTILVQKTWSGTFYSSDKFAIKDDVGNGIINLYSFSFEKINDIEDEEIDNSEDYLTERKYIEQRENIAKYNFDQGLVTCVFDYGLKRVEENDGSVKSSLCKNDMHKAQEYSTDIVSFSESYDKDSGVSTIITKKNDQAIKDNTTPPISHSSCNHRASFTTTDYSKLAEENKESNKMDLSSNVVYKQEINDKLDLNRKEYSKGRLLDTSGIVDHSVDATEYGYGDGMNKNVKDILGQFNSRRR